jgi:hypothetical protein
MPGKRWLDDKSRMNREIHVRFREGLRGRFPRATRPPSGEKFVKWQVQSNVFLIFRVEAACGKPHTENI